MNVKCKRKNMTHTHTNKSLEILLPIKSDQYLEQRLHKGKLFFNAVKSPEQCLSLPVSPAMRS